MFPYIQGHQLIATAVGPELALSRTVASDFISCGIISLCHLICQTATRLGLVCTRCPLRPLLFMLSLWSYSFSRWIRSFAPRILSSMIFILVTYSRFGPHWFTQWLHRANLCRALSYRGRFTTGHRSIGLTLLSSKWRSMLHFQSCTPANYNMGN